MQKVGWIDLILETESINSCLVHFPAVTAGLSLLAPSPVLWAECVTVLGFNGFRGGTSDARLRRGFNIYSITVNPTPEDKGYIYSATTWCSSSSGRRT